MWNEESKLLKNLPFEWFVALRYLKAKRKQAFISLITVISIAGVTVGVMALIVVIAVMAGFEAHLKEKILGVTSHIVVRSIERPIDDPNALQRELVGISVPPNGLWASLMSKLGLANSGARVVAATPMILMQGLLSSDINVYGTLIRGVDPKTISNVMDVGKVMQGKGLEALEDWDSNRPPPIVVGKELARNLGLYIGKNVRIALPTGTITPMGTLPKIRNFTVVGITSTGVYEYDSTLAFVHIKEAQRLLGLQNQAHLIELKVSDIYQTDRLSAVIQQRIGNGFLVLDWQKLSRNLFSAMKLEKLAMFIILTLIVIVAALNIISTLILMVMDKNQDIAILKAMGATDRQILHIFIYNGLMVGLIGTFLGVVSGIVLCSLLKHYKFISIPSEVYYTDSLPILLNMQDVVIIAVSAVLICFGATIYPAKQAARVNPSAALRIG
jgi:lipoprotein-releasing system permease protein